MGWLGRRSRSAVPRRRQNVDEHLVGGLARLAPNQHHRSLASRSRDQPTWPRIVTSWTISARISSRPPTTARHGRRSLTDRRKRLRASDPRRPGPPRSALCRGRKGVYVSFDAGASWQSLQLNLPAAPVHDLLVKDADVVIGTHGRSFWILDDVAPLRQITDRSDTVFGAPVQRQTHVPSHGPPLRQC